MNQRYDCIVIGSDLSSLTAAAVLSRAGVKTLRLSENSMPGHVEKGGFLFDADPLPRPGVVSNGLAVEGLRRRGIPFSATAGDPAGPGQQFILRDHRLNLFDDPAQTVTEFVREFDVSPDLWQKLYARGEKIIRCLDDVFSRSFEAPGRMTETPAFSLKNLALQKQNGLGFRRTRKRLEESHPGLGKILHANGFLFSNAALAEKPPFSSPYAFMASFGGGRRIWGEKGELDRVLEGFCSSGGSVSLSGCTVMRFRVKRRIEVDLSRDGECWTIEGDRAVLSTKWEKLRPILLRGTRFLALEKKWSRVFHTGYPLTLHMGIRQEALPEQAGRSIVLLENEKHPLMAHELIYLSAGPGENEASFGGDGRALSATVFLHQSPWRLGDAELEDVFKTVLRNVLVFLPFLRDRLVFMDPSWSMDFSRKYQEMLNHKYGAPLSWVSPLSGFPSKTPLEQVFLTGGLQFPELGFDGEILSGIFSADAILGGTRHE